MFTFTLKTSSRVQFLNITSEIRRAIAETGLKEGTALVYVPHTTAGITINEAADPAVVSGGEAASREQGLGSTVFRYLHRFPLRLARIMHRGHAS